MLKKYVPLLLATTAIICGCSSASKNNKKLIASNLETFLFDKEAEFLTPEVTKISANLEANHNFALYFTNEGCGDCETFKPIVTNYLKESKMMIYKFDVEANREELQLFNTLYGERFFTKNQSGAFVVSAPMFCVINENNIDWIKKESYMKTYEAFKNHLNSKYRVDNLYYGEGNIPSLDYINKEFTYISYNQSNPDLNNLYKEKIAPLLNESSKKIIVSNNPIEDEINLKITGKTISKTYFRNEIVVTSETPVETIKSYL